MAKGEPVTPSHLRMAIKMMGGKAMTNAKTDMRALLTADPQSFDELLDLFETYVSTVSKALLKDHLMPRAETGGGEQGAPDHSFSVAADAEDMAARLKQLRAARNAGTDVTLVLTADEADQTGNAADEAQYLLIHAASVFGHLHRDGPDADGRTFSAITDLCRRAFEDAAAKEGDLLAGLSSKLRAARRPVSASRENAA